MNFQVCQYADIVNITLFIFHNSYHNDPQFFYIIWSPFDPYTFQSQGSILHALTIRPRCSIFGFFGFRVACFSRYPIAGFSALAGHYGLWSVEPPSLLLIHIIIHININTYLLYQLKPSILRVYYSAYHTFQW